MTLRQLRYANMHRHAEWWAKQGGGKEETLHVSLSFRGNELAGEVGEACNVIKKMEREMLGLRGSRATKKQLADELADVLICVDLIAMDQDIDLGDAVIRKFNATSDKYELRTKMTEPGAHSDPADYDDDIK